MLQDIYKNDINSSVEFYLVHGEDDDDDVTFDLVEMVDIDMDV